MAYSDPIVTPASGNPYIDGLSWGSNWKEPGSDVTHLKLNIAGRFGDVQFDFGGTTVLASTKPVETAAFKLAMSLIEQVCNIDFQLTNLQSDADIIVGAVDNADADGNLGLSVPPGEDLGPNASKQGAVIVNYQGYSSVDLSSVARGGYDFISFIHELLHAVGLKHPHDFGGGQSPLFPGVADGAGFGDLGNFDLNQGLYTVMSYNDGFVSNPDGQLSADVVSYGYEGGPMALDIAALQYMYGANTSFHTGNNRYVLPSANQLGTFYQCLWDAGGTDLISNNSSVESTIDLRPATILEQAGGGGYLSALKGIYGGFTIARNVVIENATGGSAKDRLVGNDVANILQGMEGNDYMSGGRGDDTLLGGNGNDFMMGGKGDDRFVFHATGESLGRADTIAGFTSGDDVISVTWIDSNVLKDGNQAFRFGGLGELSGTVAECRFEHDDAANSTIVSFDTNGDAIADMKIVLNGLIDLTNTDFLL